MPIRQPGSLTKNGSTCPPELPADHHFPNPESEWLREPVPDLRILDDDLWTAVQSRQKALSEIPTAHIRKPKRLLSGLVKRGECGGAMTLYGQKLSCNAHRERGTCKNTKVIAIKTVARRVLEGLKAKLLAPKAVAGAVRQQTEASAASRKQILANRAPIERELAEIGRRLARTQEMSLNGVLDMAEAKTLSDKLKAHRGELEATLASVEAPTIVAPHPGLTDRYQQISERLHEALDREDGENMRTELRALIERIDFVPLEGLGKFELKVHGKHKALVLSERASASLTGCEGRLGAGPRSGRYPTVIPVVFAA